jgi:hypothetical protein
MRSLDLVQALIRVPQAVYGVEIVLLPPVLNLVLDVDSIEVVVVKLPDQSLQVFRVFLKMDVVHLVYAQACGYLLVVLPRFLLLLFVLF